MREFDIFNPDETTIKIKRLCLEIEKRKITDFYSKPYSDCLEQTLSTLSYLRDGNESPNEKQQELRKVMMVLGQKLNQISNSMPALKLKLYLYTELNLEIDEIKKQIAERPTLELDYDG